MHGIYIYILYTVKWYSRDCTRAKYCMRAGLELAACLAGWFAVSIGITLFNKVLFTTVRIPLTVTCMHLLVRVPLVLMAMAWLGVDAANYTRRELGLWAAPMGASMALDIGLSNASFLFISVTYYTIVKSSVPLWVLFFSVLLGLQRPSYELVGVVLAIVIGIALSSVSSDMLANETPDMNSTAQTYHGSKLEAPSLRLARRHCTRARTAPTPTLFPPHRL